MGVKDVLGFEGFNLKRMGRMIKEDPKRLLLGVDPASTKVWNKVLNKDDKPIVDQWGGPTKDAYKEAEAAGIDTRSGKGMHKLARVIAATIAGGYGAQAAGFGGGAAGGGASGATNPALIESSVGTSGYGMSSASSGFQGAGGMSGMSGMQRFQMMQQMMPKQQQQQQDPYQPADIVETTPYQGIDDGMVTSTKKAKKPIAKARMTQLVQKGLSGEDPISTNGVEVLAIQALAKKVRELEAEAKRRGIKV